MKFKTHLFALMFLLIFSCNKKEDEPCTLEAILTTNPVSEITDISAKLSGTFEAPTCAPTVTSKGFIYGKTAHLKISDNVVKVNHLEDSLNLTGLEPNTKYYVKTFLITPLTISAFYGNEVSFTTAHSDRVYNGDIALYTQQEVDEFGTNNYTKINGALIIGDYSLDITSLSALSSITSVGGDLIIRGNKITSLTGLENITSVNGDLSIGKNFSLSSISALSNLTSVGGLILEYINVTSLTALSNITSIDGDLIISDNRALTSLAGLNNITSVGGDLSIIRNNTTSLSALSSITSVGGDLAIIRNQALTSLTGLENITSIGSDSNRIVIADNASLTSLSALSGITSVSGDLNINFNKALTSLTGLENISSIGGSLIISDNPLTSLLALSNLTSINLRINISRNNALTSLAGLENINLLSGSSLKGLLIENNDALTSISTLSSFTAVDGDISIEGNDALTSLAGLNNITSVRDLLITSNLHLINFCDIKPLIDINGIQRYYLANYNAYNPTIQDIKNDKCSQ